MPRHEPARVERLPCQLPLARQVTGREAATVRQGEHPRTGVHRLDLLADEELDHFRSRHAVAAEEALDGALALEAEIDRALSEREIDASRLASLPARPILAVFVSLACGASTTATCRRAWPVDRAMRATGLPEREVLRVDALVRQVLGSNAPDVDLFAPGGIAELLALVGHDVDHEALRQRLLDLLATTEGASRE